MAPSQKWSSSQTSHLLPGCQRRPCHSGQSSCDWPAWMSVGRSCYKCYTCKACCGCALHDVCINWSTLWIACCNQSLDRRTVAPLCDWKQDKILPFEDEHQNSPYCPKCNFHDSLSGILVLSQGILDNHQRQLFHSRLLGDLAIEWHRGLRWPCLWPLCFCCVNQVILM